MRETAGGAAGAARAGRRRAVFGAGLLPKYPADRFRALARRCEEAGFAYLWIPDEKFYRDTYTQLTLAAEHTREVRLGTAVTDPYSRHPAITAAAIGAVAELSQGRAVLGIGAGVSGHAEMGIDRVKPAQAVRESVELIRRLLAGERVTKEDGVIRFYDGRLEYTPAFEVPVFVAAAAPRMLSVAGEVGDGVLLGDLCGPEALVYGFEQVRRGAEKAGRSLDAIHKVAWLQTFLHPHDGEKARNAARWTVALFLWASRAYHDLLGLRLAPELAEAINFQRYRMAPEDVGEAARLVDDNLVRSFALAGTPLEVARQVEALFAAGVDQVAIHPWPVDGFGSEEAIDLFAREVMPRFLAGGAG